MPTRTISTQERKKAAEPVARLIRHVANERGITLVELADRLGVSHNSLYQKLRGDTPIELAMLKRIALALEIRPGLLLESPDELMGWAARDSNPEPAGGMLFGFPAIANRHARFVTDTLSVAA